MNKRNAIKKRIIPPLPLHRRGTVPLRGGVAFALANDGVVNRFFNYIIVYPIYKSDIQFINKIDILSIEKPIYKSENQLYN